MGRNLRPFSLALLLIAPLGVAGSPAPARAAALTCEALPNLVDAILQNHVRYRTLDDGIEERAIDAYVRRLDPSRT